MVSTAINLKIKTCRTESVRQSYPTTNHALAIFSASLDYVAICDPEIGIFPTAKYMTPCASTQRNIQRSNSRALRRTRPIYLRQLAANSATRMITTVRRLNAWTGSTVLKKIRILAST